MNPCIYGTQSSIKINKNIFNSLSCSKQTFYFLLEASSNFLASQLGCKAKQANRHHQLKNDFFSLVDFDGVPKTVRLYRVKILYLMTMKANNNSSIRKRYPCFKFKRSRVRIPIQAEKNKPMSFDQWGAQ